MVFQHEFSISPIIKCELCARLDDSLCEDTHIVVTIDTPHAGVAVRLVICRGTVDELRLVP